MAFWNPDNPGPASWVMKPWLQDNTPGDVTDPVRDRSWVDENLDPYGETINDPEPPTTGAGASTSTDGGGGGGGAGTGSGAPPVTPTGQIPPYNPQSAALQMFQGGYDWKPQVAWNPKWTTAEGVQMDALTKALQDPLWTPENIAAMKEVQKEQALSMAGQLKAEGNQRFAGMNRVPSGARQAMLGDIDSETAGEILAAYRDLDLGTRQQNAEYTLRASDALNSALGGQFGRQYDITRLNEGQRQFDLSHFLAVMDFLEKQRQFNEDLGFRYGALGAGMI
jgi:hypothetical protein